MRLIDFNIFPRVPDVFAGTIEYVSALVVTRRDVLLYLEHFKAGNGSVKLSANLAADSTPMLHAASNRDEGGKHPCE